MAAESPLAKELRTFAEHKDELLAKHQGKFVLIKGDRLLDVFDTENDAYKEGIHKFGPSEPFLVKQILDVDLPAHYVHVEF